MHVTKSSSKGKQNKETLYSNCSSSLRCFSKALMNLEIALYPLVEGLAPQSFPDKSINLLCRQLAEVLQQPTKSLEQIQTIIDSYKIQFSHNNEDYLRWQKLINFLQLLLGIEGPNEMMKYLTALQTAMINNSPTRLPAFLNQQSPTDLYVNGIDNHDKLLSPLRPLSLQAESFENLDKFSDRRSIISSNMNYGIVTNHDSVTLEALADPYYSKMMPEDKILKYIPYTLLSTTSDTFPVDWNDIKIPYNIPNAESELLHVIFEAGLLHQQLKRCIELNKNNDISPMKKALIVQVDEELRSYIAFVNGLSSSYKLKSLKTVLFELYDYVSILRFYYNFTKNFSNYSGISFLSEANILRLHGNLLVKKASSELFRNLSSIYFEYIINWLTMGQLEATYEEFFIKSTDSNENLIRFEIIPAKVPALIPMRVAKEIFLIGKTYIFLARFCKELQWTNDLSKKYLKLYRNLSTEELSNGFSSISHKHYQEIVNYSNKVIFSKLHYKKVIYALKDILLMGKSDLVDSLIKRASKILITNADSLSSYTLTTYLQDAVRSTSFRNMINRSDQNYVINGLDARVLNLGHGSLGWDVFTLDYIVDRPLSIVLNVNRQNGKKEYLRMFNFLWKFKKNDYFYNQEWLRTNQLVKNFKKLPAYRPLVRDILTKLSKLNILRAQLNNFNLKLESHCFKSIIDESFQEFEERLNISSKSSKSNTLPTIKLKSGLIMLDGLMKPNNKFLDNIKGGDHFHCDQEQCALNIDELDKLHNQYLTTMLSHKLISSDEGKKIGYFSGQPYPTSLIQLLNIIFEFIGHYSALNDVAHEVLIQLNLHTQQQQLNNLLTRFNSVLGNVVSQFRIFEESAHLFIKDLISDGDANLASLSRLLR